jgi:ribosome-associated protein
VLRCANAALDKKADELVIMDMRGISSFTDYFIICSGRSDRQVQGIADSVGTEMKKAGIPPLGIEGFTEGKWVLLDYGDVVVHVFYAPIREFYDLERLWADAPRIELES